MGSSGAGSVLCCLLIVAAVVALLVWVSRRGRSAVDNALDRKVGRAPADMVLEGGTTGLNARGGQARRAQLRVGAGYVAVGWMTVGRVAVEVFPAEEILSVHEGDMARTGLDGFFASANANTNIGQAFGWRADAPGLLLRTRRGDLGFTVGAKRRGELRQTVLAIGELIGDTGPGTKPDPKGR